MNWKVAIMFALPAIQYLETQMRNKDNNDTGKDDKWASFLGYVRKGLNGLLSDGEVPKPPKDLL